MAASELTKMNNRNSGLRFFLQALACTIVLTAPAIAGNWNSSERLERARSGLAATSVNDLIYVGGGAAAGDPANAFDVFDPEKESWRALPALPVGLISFAMAETGKQIYITGGYSADDPGEPRKDVWAYDIDAATWTRKASMPLARAAHAMASVGGKIYVIGGAGPQASKTLIYNPQSDSWKTGPDLATPRRALAAASDGKRIYVIGGIKSDGAVSAALEVFDPVNAAWTSLPAMPAARGALTAAIVGGQLHVVGGATWKPLKTYANHDVFSIAARTWSKAQSLPSARQGMASGVASGRLWIFGGGSGAGVFGMFTASDSVDAYEP